MEAVPDAGAARLGAGAAQPGPAGSRPDVDSESMEDLLEWELQVAEGVRAVPPPFAPGRLRAEMAGSGRLGRLVVQHPGPLSSTHTCTCKI